MVVESSTTRPTYPVWTQCDGRRNRESVKNGPTYVAAGVLGFVFAFGGVYLNAREGNQVEAEEPNPNVATIDVNVLRRIMNDSVPPVPTQADAPDRKLKRPGYPSEVVEHDHLPGPGQREDWRKW